MGREQVRRLDLNLLLAFEALIAERNVTRAADRMSVGQPAMSASLARLRTIFGDPLLIREGRSLVPTPPRPRVECLLSRSTGPHRFGPAREP
jgi:DNA-binding transcriptional LysR family regulator